MSTMLRDMKGPWDNFLALLTEERSAEIITSIEAVMDWAVEYLGMLSRETGLSLTTF